MPTCENYTTESRKGVSLQRISSGTLKRERTRSPFQSTLLKFLDDIKTCPFKITRPFVSHIGRTQQMQVR